MKLSKLRIKNFRALKYIEVTIEEHLSVIVGKNNTGKTSLLLALERFLNSTSKFSFDDFNIEFQNELVDIIKNQKAYTSNEPLGISLRLFIEYGENDDLSNVGNKIIMDLDPDNRWIILDFLYHIPPEVLSLLQRDYQDHQNKKGDNAKTIIEFLRDSHSKYFQISKRSVQYEHAEERVLEEIYVDLIKEGIKLDDIISFKRINARRSVSNKDTERGLSSISSRIYEAKVGQVENNDLFERFNDALTQTDQNLNAVYEDLFKEVIEDVNKFGGIREGDTNIQIKSTLQHRNLLENNTTVMYGKNNEPNSLPEGYYGLGYLNLINIIFEITLILNQFKRVMHSKPADINLLFIEEPEAHTHPQLQAIFIKNIKNLIKNSITNNHGVKRPLQTLLSTHSAHIVSESNFNDIKYFKRNENGIEAKNLKDMKKMYLDSKKENHYKFLKQYLTLNSSQLFFADKAILIEGATERILLPAMMLKQDQSDDIKAWKSDTKPTLPLLSQNISIIEIGAHSHVFEIFLDFIGVKTLIITDLDSVRKEYRLNKDKQPILNKNKKPILDKKAAKVECSTHTANSALQFYLEKDDLLSTFINRDLSSKKTKKNKQTPNSWSADPTGIVLCVYQTNEKNKQGDEYHARSFEDAFFHVNLNFFNDICKTEQNDIDSSDFPSLIKKHFSKYLKGGSPYDMAEKGVAKKTSFAIEILLNSKTSKENIQNSATGKVKTFEIECDNWETPKYIQEGLEWLKQD